MRMRDLPPERWSRIDALFTRALEVDARERDGFLDRACGEDTLLREALDELLAADAAAERELGEHAADFAGGLVDDLWAGIAAGTEGEDLPPGSRVGPYRVERELGRGGMGRVYLAERADEHFEKRVALKLVKRGMDTDEVLRRFRQERQILAGLEHPGIARLLDGGVAPDGRPYLVMEHVEGRPLDRWMAEARPALPERLRLLVRVCDAVRHAHRRFVVHRDLKPSNVLVTPGGEPRLLDFGIAKLLSDDEGAPRTRTGQRVLTPELAAPEQLRGEPASTATDVHGLGVLLYILLTGERPYDGTLRTGDPAEPAPGPPSGVVEDAAARRRLRGDLDVIALRALHPDPDRRYDSAAALADDVRRHLEGRPVRARRDSLGYRLRKFVGRHRAGVLAAGVAAVILTVAGGVAVRERIERDREARASLAVSQFMERLFEASDPLGDAGGQRLDTLPAFALLDRAVERMDADLGENPRARARLLHTLGSVYMNSGAMERGDSLLREAVALRRANDEPPGALGESLMLVGRAALERGRFDEAEAPLREALALDEALDPRDRAATLVNLAVVHQERGEEEAADSLYRLALEGFRAVPGTEVRQANVLSNLGALAMRRGDFQAALPLAREALALYRPALDPDHPVLARGINNLAAALRRTGDAEAAEPLYREALEIFRRSLRSPHPMLAIGTLNLANTLEILGRDDEAEPLMRAALDEARAAFPPDHPQRTAIVTRIADFLSRRGTPAARAEAEALYREVEASGAAPR